MKLSKFLLQKLCSFFMAPALAKECRKSRQHPLQTCIHCSFIWANSQSPCSSWHSCEAHMDDKCLASECRDYLVIYLWRPWSRYRVPPLYVLQSFAQVHSIPIKSPVQQYLRDKRPSHHNICLFSAIKLNEGGLISTMTYLSGPFKRDSHSGYLHPLWP